MNVRKALKHIEETIRHLKSANNHLSLADCNGELNGYNSEHQSIVASLDILENLKRDLEQELIK